ncbi:MAG: hypothetical protein GTO14_16220 [Anaerolineales bacterium]|nr:hypothetical protein [Anaerolineales bacterium]
MNRNRIWIAIGAFVLPIIVRGFWFYERVYRAPSSISTPGYAELVLPVSPTGSEPTAVEKPEAKEKIVLVDWAHSNQFNITEIEDFLDNLTASGASVELVPGAFDRGGPPLGQRLKYASAYVVIAPQDAFTPQTVQLVSRFVSRGGRLLVISDPTRGGNNASFEGYFGENFPAVIAANSLLVPFDIAFSDDYLYNLLQNEGNFRNVLFHSFAEDPLTEGLTTTAFYGARSVTTHTGIPLIIGDDNTFSSRTDTSGDHTVVMRSSDGGVLAIGDLTFLTNPYQQVADNPLFIARLIEFLIGGDLTRDFTDYPYIFRDPVAILKTETFGLTAETLKPISRLQTLFASRGIPLFIVDEPPDETSLIVLSPYRADESIRSMLESFEDLILPEEEEEGTLSIPLFGEINPAGVGLMLLDLREEQTRLFLLAEGPEELLTLTQFLEGDDLDDCLIREWVALCKVGEGEGFDFDTTPDDEESDYEFDNSLLENYPVDPTVPPPPPS